MNAHASVTVERLAREWFDAYDQFTKSAVRVGSLGPPASGTTPEVNEALAEVRRRMDEARSNTNRKADAVIKQVKHELHP